MGCASSDREFAKPEAQSTRYGTGADDTGADCMGDANRALTQSTAHTDKARANSAGLGCVVADRAFVEPEAQSMQDDACAGGTGAGCASADRALATPEARSALGKAHTSSARASDTGAG